MLIKQTRINSLKHFSFLEPQSVFTLVIKDIERFPEKVTKFGFSPDLQVGSRILPSTFNRCAFKNAEQYATIDKSFPKEKYFQTLYWTRTEWAGGGETREVTEFTDIERTRYHRDYHLPFSVEFTLQENDKGIFICSETLVFSDENKDEIINTVNMLLGLFGECEVIAERLKDPVNIIHLSWDVLPSGQYPWSKVKADIEKIVSNRTNTQQQMMFKNCEIINNLNPDFVAYGRAGFKGYAIFGFVDKNLYILESTIPNNATYVFENNWQHLSKLTKAQILDSNLHKLRVIHNSSWNVTFNKVMEGIV